MAKRALRRHQQRVARIRHIRIVWQSHQWTWDGSPFNSQPEGPHPRRLWYTPARRRPWQQVSRCTMNGEPKAWQYDFNIRPSRVRQNQLLRGIERGIDPDLVRRWPDYRKPHVYYW
jgi:hypothetical protein